MPAVEATCVFGAHQALVDALLDALQFDPDDGSHDLAHLIRVWASAARIQASEGGDAEILAAAVVLHDCVSVEKNSPLRSQASRLAAEKAEQLLERLGWAAERRAAVAHAIEAHSFSAGIEPRSLEACIVQDADRLDAIGAVGIARCFYVAGRLRSRLYDAADPFADGRTLDDAQFALDHFPAKLLGLATGFRTATGRALAEARHRTMLEFLDAFGRDIGVPRAG